jgi:hypothetical protein
MEDEVSQVRKELSSLPPEPIDLRLVEVFLEMSPFCREDIKDISPGWGYAGPHQTAQEERWVGDMTVYRTVSDEDYIEVEDLFNEKHWKAAPNAQVKSIQTAIQYGDHSLDQCLAWIPANIEEILERAVETITDVELTVTNVKMEPADPGHELQIVFSLSDGTEVIGAGSSVLAAALRLYIYCWDIGHEMSMLSITDLEGDFDVNHLWENEPTVEFREYADVLQFVSNDTVVRHGENTVTNAKDLKSTNYVGKFSFWEGDYHVVFLPTRMRRVGNWEKPK